jgi:hypothetical protein
MMDVKEDDRVVSIARTSTAELKKAGATTNGNGEAEKLGQIELPL